MTQADDAMTSWAYDNATISNAVAEYRALEAQRRSIHKAQQSLRWRIAAGRIAIANEEVEPLVELALHTLLSSLVRELRDDPQWRGSLEAGPLRVVTRDWWPNNPVPLASIGGVAQLTWRDEPMDEDMAAPLPRIGLVIDVGMKLGINGEVWTAMSQMERTVSLVVHSLALVNVPGEILIRA